MDGHGTDGHDQINSLFVTNKKLLVTTNINSIRAFLNKFFITIK